MAARQPQVLLLAAKQARQLYPSLRLFVGVFERCETLVEQLRRRIAGHIAVRGVRIPDAAFEIEHDHADGRGLHGSMKQCGRRNSPRDHFSQYRWQLSQKIPPGRIPQLSRRARWQSEM